MRKYCKLAIGCALTIATQSCSLRKWEPLNEGGAGKGAGGAAGDIADGGKSGSEHTSARSTDVGTNGGTSGSGGTTSTIGGAESTGGSSSLNTTATGGTTSTTQTNPSGLTVVASALPDGDYNTPYYAQLSATGGMGPSFFSWSLSSGTLPTGLILGTNGEITGTPLGSGTFEFTVLVRDNQGNWGERATSLLVRRKRWLAYGSEQATPGRRVTYLRDYADPTRPLVDLSVYASASCPVNRGPFSPDGRRFTFKATRGASCDQTWLYVVDVSAETVGTAQRVDKNGTVQGYPVWSPDSKWLTYNEGGNGAYTKYIVDMSGSAPSTPVVYDTDTTIGIHLQFASPRLIFWLNSKSYITHTVLKEDGKWLSPETSTANCSYLSTVTESGRALCLQTTPHTVGSVYNVATRTSSEDMSWGFAANLTMAVDFYNKATGASNPTGLLKWVDTNTAIPINMPLTSRPSVVWSHKSASMVATPTPDLDALYVTINPGGWANAYVISSTAGFTTVEYSTNDNWIAWASKTSVALSDKFGSNLQVVSAPIAATSTRLTDLNFAPNSEHLAFAGQLENTGPTELFPVDLATGKTRVARKMNGTLGAGSSVATNGFTPDSAYIYYEVGDFGKQTLYLSSVLSQEPLGLPLASNYSGADFQFQP
ncbi:MAG: hypothetical protein QM784_35410 [Polyangiaceae bacterium]